MSFSANPHTRYLRPIPTDVQVDGEISPEDARFGYLHAYGYAGGDREFSNRANRYAAWYYRTYVVHADGLEDVPDHPRAWGEFLAQDDQAHDDLLEESEA